MNLGGFLKIIKIFLNILLVVLIIIFLFQIVQNKYIENKNYEEAASLNPEVDSSNCNSDMSLESEISNEVLNIKSVDESEVIGYVCFPTTGSVTPLKTGTTSDNNIEALEDGSMVVDMNSNLPGNNENSVILGHRNTNINEIYELEVGDPIVIIVNDNKYVYEVTRNEVIEEEEVEKVFLEKDNDYLVLYTCYPQERYTPITGRYIVEAKPLF